MVDKLTGEQFTLITAYGADGKFSQEEIDALKMKGINEEILKELQGAKNNEEIGDIVSKYLNDKEMPEEKNKFVAWLERSPHNMAKMLGLGGALGAIGGKLMFMAGLAGGVSSCVDYDHHEFNFNFEFTAESSNEEIIKELQRIYGKLGEIESNQEELNTKVENIYTTLVNKGVQLDRIIEILEGMGVKADSIIELLENNTLALNNVGTDIKNKLDEILNEIKDGNELSDENNALLTDILAKLVTLEANDNTAKDILNDILTKITKSVQNQEDMKKENYDFYQKVLAKLDAMDANQQKFAANVLAKLDTLSDDMKKGFKNVVDKIETLDENQLKFATAILAKLDAMDENQQKFAAAVLTVLEKLPKGLQDGLDNILKAVENNTLTDKEILAKLTDLFNKIGTLQPGQVTDLTVVVNAINALGGDLDAILAEIQKGNSQLDAIREAIEKNNQIAAKTNEAIGNLTTQNNKDHETIINLMKQLLAKAETDSATLDDIKAILKEIKTNTKGNWDTSLRIEDKLNLVAQTINVILETQQDLGEETKGILLQILAKITQPGLDNETKDILLKILAKIPDGCECETVDLSVIVEKLDELIKATEEGRKDPIHEGILDDLEDALG